MYVPNFSSLAGLEVTKKFDLIYYSGWLEKVELRLSQPVGLSWAELGNKNKEGQAQEDNLIISIMHFSLSELKFLLMWQKYLVQITE